MEKLQIFHVTKLLQSVIKHDPSQLIISWYAKPGHKVLPAQIALLNTLIILNQGATGLRFGQFQHEPVQVFDLDEPGRFRVKSLPNFDKILYLIPLNRQLKVICLLQKCVNYDRYEQIDEHLHDQDVKQDEKDV